MRSSDAGAVVGPPMARPGFALKVLLGGSVALAVALFGLIAYLHQTRVFEDQRTRAEQTLRLITGHAERVFGSYRSALLQLQTILLASGPENLSSEAVNARMQRLLSATPDTAAFWIFTADGRAANTTVTYPPPSVNVSGREYFKAHFGGGATWFVSQPLVGLYDKRVLFGLTHSVELQDGLRVILSATCRPEFFSDFWTRAEVPLDGFAVIFRSDGLVLSHAPPPGGNPETNRVPAELLQNALTRDRGDMTIAWPFRQGLQQAVWYARVGDFPIYVAYGVPLATLWQRWGYDVAVYSGFALPVVGLLSLLSWLLFRRSQELVSTNQQLERRIEIRTREIRDLLQAKELLMREVHHRVKNNLQTIVSLLRLQAREGGDAKTFAETFVRRLNAISLLHDQLYKTSADATEIDLKDYLTTLTGHVCDTSASADRKISCRVEGEAVVVPVSTGMTIGLIVAEALINAFKHAFSPGEGGTITVAVHRSGPFLSVSVQDDGKAGKVSCGAGEGFGSRLIATLAAQIDATLSVEDRNGRRLEITLPAPRTEPVH